MELICQAQYLTTRLYLPVVQYTIYQCQLQFVQCLVSVQTMILYIHLKLGQGWSVEKF